MNEKELKHIIDCNAEKMIEKLGLGEWQIEFNYEIPDGNDKDVTFRGCCGAHFQSKRVIITFDPRKLATEEKVISVLRHELVHLIVMTFRRYRHAAHKLFETTSLSTTDPAFVVLDAVFQSAIEEITYDICRILEKQ
ncbi:hypothetical protein LCGC14_1237950 [marine sediment metagenome]|uniref:SprT-like domain-containing protein n=1 Tax=marine sediment metagenome TaxID=412755 RepID=A0A0F9NNU8_9ZZZZ